MRWLTDEPEPGCRRVRWLFLRLLGLVNLLAFLSFTLELKGLVGSRGILPAAWSDAAMLALGWSGVILSALLIADVGPPLVLMLLWISYSTLVRLGQDFMGFQWDALLLETDFLAIFLAPLQLWPRHPDRQPGPPRASWWVLRWLLVRLMVSSGFCKLASGDPTWRNLTALTWHYETQPIPNPVAWYAHHLPFEVHRLSCAVMLFIELVVPWLVLTRWRRWAFLPLAGLQLVIALTGNYTFFNLLTLALCLAALDDGKSGQGRSGWPPGIVGPICAALLVGSVVRMPWLPVYRYGLFAVMTTERPEILFEGSRDGQEWREYGYRYHPQDPDRAPPFLAPLHARMDWQLWFAAMGPPAYSPWLNGLARGLLTGSPDVLALFASNPFADGPPPRYVRASLWHYRFDERTWWKREKMADYAGWEAQ